MEIGHSDRKEGSNPNADLRVPRLKKQSSQVAGSEEYGSLLKNLNMSENRFPQQLSAESPSVPSCLKNTSKFPRPNLS